jgi:hypothetical protein
MSPAAERNDECVTCCVRERVWCSWFLNESGRPANASEHAEMTNGARKRQHLGVTVE